MSLTDRSISVGLTAILCMAFLSTSGCERLSSVTPDSLATAADETNNLPFGPETDRKFNFGVILAGSNEVRTHRYRLENCSNSPVTLLSINNLKPCCGIVETIKKSVLLPHEAIEIPVTVKIGDLKDTLVHRFAIETDCPRQGNLVFETRADIRPNFRVEEIGERVARVPVGSEHVHKFLLTTYRAVRDSIGKLDDAVLKAKAECSWTSGPKTNPAIHNVIESTRTFQLRVAASDEPGVHSEAIIVESGREMLGKLIFNYEVIASLVVSPSNLVINRSDERVEKKIVVRSMDGQEFQIVHIDPRFENNVKVLSRVGPLSSIVLGFSSYGAELEVGPQEIQIELDHPTQKHITIPILVL